MANEGTSSLLDVAKARAFYEDRYKTDYMDEWPAWKRERVRRLVEELPLPETGSVLDFGCGNGVFSDVLCQALPGWRVYGSDLSDTAVSNARKRFPDCTFFHAREYDTYRGAIDLAFSHHVFEHVPDPQAALEQLNETLKPDAFMFHILPCGNPGSLEHRICELRTDGIDPERGGRFFFEDEGHLRRLTTDQFVELAAPLGFSLSREFYAYQADGAFQWIHPYGADFKLSLTDTENAVDPSAARELLRIRRRLLRSARSRKLIERYNRWRKRPSTGAKHYVGTCCGLPVYVLAKLHVRFVSWAVNTRAEAEWRRSNHLRNGSEMYLFFARRDAVPR